ncbi:unnamed protein product [Effrenium voratum]|uniref:Uncharacterized protein n=1 Tax=Effrenium voratum TaxID=2562239 RepID=A0AA36IEH1_9DINO|nr:unnamed protein product [Effrenium voratum]CAJ1426023.1 unnamed protein product [Effrenium voratum]
MMQAEEPQKQDSDQPVDFAWRLMQKAIKKTWQNHPSERREALADEEISAKLRMVLRRAVAALSPPRCLGDGCDGKMPASIACNDQSTLATNMQSRLRKIVLGCLD